MNNSEISNNNVNENDVISNEQPVVLESPLSDMPVQPENNVVDVPIEVVTVEGEGTQTDSVVSEPVETDNTQVVEVQPEVSVDTNVEAAPVEISVPEAPVVQEVENSVASVEVQDIPVVDTVASFDTVVTDSQAVPVVSESTNVEVSSVEVSVPVVESIPAVENTVTNIGMQSTPTVTVEQISPESVTSYNQTNLGTSTAPEAVVENNKKKNKGLIIGIVVLLVAVLLVIGYFVMFGNKKTADTGKEPSSNNPEVIGTLIENVSISGFGCSFDECIYIVNGSNYAFKGDDSELFNILYDYKDYLNINIYVTGEGEDVSIVNYEAFIKSTNEKIEGIKTGEELRIKLGLYNLGVHTAELTLTNIGSVVFSSDGTNSYTYREYSFLNDNGIEFEMDYMSTNNAFDETLAVGNKYTVTFEVEEGIFDYDYVIMEIK